MAVVDGEGGVCKATLGEAEALRRHPRLFSRLAARATSGPKDKGKNTTLAPHAPHRRRAGML